MTQPTVVEKRCVVCGTGSHRVDWQSVEFPACDSHSKDEIADAIKAVKQKGKGAQASTAS